MREVVLVMPNGPGKPQIACEVLREWLATECGGFSEYEGQGAWRNPATHKTECEPHSRFVVAVRDETMASIAIDQLRHEAAWAGEKAIYYVDTRGEVHIEDVGMVAKQAR